MKLRNCILSLSVMCMSFAYAAQPAPPSPPGSPSSTKFWDVPGQQKKTLKDMFKGRADKERYFVSSMTGMEFEKGSEVLIGPNVDYQSKNVSIFDKIVFLEHIDKTAQERIRIKRINRFLDTNYKTQILPEEAYDDSGLPKPFYLNELRSWAFKAVRNSDIDTLRALLDNYNLLKIQNRDGLGLLSYAISFNGNRIARFLIRRGANINETDNHNQTPLNIAARNNNEVMVGILAKSGCDVHHKDNSGKSSSDYALMNNNRGMHRYLRGGNK